MYQILYILTNTNIPLTRLISFQEFKRHQNGKCKEYILTLLKSCPDGLTCREISQISGIEIQSLTNPLKELQNTNKIKVTGIRKSIASNRMVQVYSL